MKTLNKKTCAALMLVAVSAGPLANVQAATCGNFEMNAASGSGTVLSCTTEDKNIEIQGGNNVVTNPGQDTLFTNVTDLTGSITGITPNAPQDANGFGTFSIDASIWDSWDSIYIGLKQGNAYGLFLLTEAVFSGTWKTAPGGGTGLSHYIAFGGDPGPAPDPVPVPAAVWLFGSGLLGLIGAARRKSAAA
ncbi:hypothetical protein [Methylobacter luteus]|uniref:hypothetical protein n=1 Tax=Methylobacter luteus TaxID=415 RepID=UPI000418FBBE|nr:hypothetical protein [Methylobacter luteus]